MKGRKADDANQEVKRMAPDLLIVISSVSHPWGAERFDGGIGAAHKVKDLQQRSI